MNKHVKGVSSIPGNDYILPSIDISQPSYEIAVEVNKNVLYVHVNGQTVLRISDIINGLVLPK